MAAASCRLQFGAIGYQLGLVGHRTNQRMPECVLDPRCESNLVNQVGLDQLIEGRFHSQQCAQRVRRKP